MSPPSPSASWIWLPSYDDTIDPGRFVLFRRSFKLAQVPTSPCPVKVSADTRYRLLVNGKSVCFGPCKSYLERWYYETVDIAPFLVQGDNVVAAKVLRFSPKHAGNSNLIRAALPGFWLEGIIGDEPLHTSPVWKSHLDESIRLAQRSEWNYVLGPPFMCLDEQVDSRKAQKEWTLPSHDDSDWPAAEIVTIKTKMMPVLDHRKLFERPIPLLSEISEHFIKAVQSTGDGGIALNIWDELLRNDKAIKVPRNTTVSVDIQAEKLTTGFLELSCDGGLDSDIIILSAEGYEKKVDLTSPFPRRQKGDRLATEGNDLYGPIHKYTCCSDSHTYEPFWFNTFRFVRLTITTRSEPLTLHRFTYRATHYPLKVHSQITATPEIEDMWRISIDTLRNCMHETYEDCPMYEQNQFAMDARLQMLFTYQLSRDDRLARKTIHEFFSSRRDDGLVETHFPVPFRAINIPQFSLFWVLMIHDHMMYFGDRTLVKRYIGAVDGVLGHFEERVDEQGLVGRFDDEAWPFVDWVKEWFNPAAGGLAGMGIPLVYQKGGVATYNSLIYAFVLSHAADLCDYLSRHDTAAEYRDRAKALVAAVNEHCWDSEAAMYTDGPGTKDRCQHSQIFAILAEAIQGEDAKNLMDRAVKDKSLPKCSYAMGFYVLRAAEKVGLYTDLFPTLVEPWKAMMRNNLSTWAEDDVNCRSDCHGWSASPIYEIVAVIAGLRPRAPGYEMIGFEPRRELLESFSGVFPVAEGAFSVSWKPEEAFKLEFPPDKELTSTLTVNNVSRSGERTLMELGSR